MFSTKKHVPGAGVALVGEWRGFLVRWNRPGRHCRKSCRQLRHGFRVARSAKTFVALALLNCKKKEDQSLRRVRMSHRKSVSQLTARFAAMSAWPIPPAPENLAIRHERHARSGNVLLSRTSFIASLVPRQF